MARRSCPFCGEAHPATIDEDSNPGAEPDCAHWIGRWDTDDGFQEQLEFLNELEFPPLATDEEPAKRFIREAFGDLARVAMHTYEDGFTQWGSAYGFLQGLRRQCGIRYITIGGTSVMGWSYTDFFANAPDKAVAEVQAATSTIRDGMQCLQPPAASRG
jgi:hypothetical protein